MPLLATASKTGSFFRSSSAEISSVGITFGRSRLFNCRTYGRFNRSYPGLQISPGYKATRIRIHPLFLAVRHEYYTVDTLRMTLREGRNKPGGDRVFKPRLSRERCPVRAA